jgi:hypothetical protein
MIKNWKLFLESFENDDEFNREIEEFKELLKKEYKSILDLEEALRHPLIGADESDIEEVTDIIMDSLLHVFKMAIEERIKEGEDNEFINIVIKAIEKAMVESRPIMLKSFNDGIDKMVDVFMSTLKGVIEASNKEGEEWREEKPLDYSTLTKSELNDIINTAIDDEDWARVKFLSQYLKESLNQESESHIKNMADILVKLTMLCLKKFAY